MFLPIEDSGPTVTLRTEFDSNGLNTSNVFKFYGPISWFIFIGYPARTPTLKISGGLSSNFFAFGFTGFLTVQVIRVLGSPGLWKFFELCQVFQFNRFCVKKLNFIVVTFLDFHILWVYICKPNISLKKKKKYFSHTYKSFLIQSR